MTFSHLALCQGFNTLEEPDSEASDLTDVLRSFWEVELLEIHEQGDEVSSSFLTGVRFVQSRYEVEFPWLRSKSDVPNHFNLCFNRLKYLQQRLIKQPEIPEKMLKPK